MAPQTDRGERSHRQSSLCAAPRRRRSPIPPPRHQLDATVVVAHRIPTDLRASKAAVSVITRADLERTQAGTLPEALRYVPGLVFSNRDGGGALPVVSARGFFGWWREGIRAPHGRWDSRQLYPHVARGVESIPVAVIERIAASADLQCRNQFGIRREVVSDRVA